MAFTYCPLWISLEVRKFSRTKNLPFTSLKARFYWWLFSRGKIKESLWRYIRLRNSKWSLCEFNGGPFAFSCVFFSFSAVFRNYLLDEEKFLLNWYDLWKHLFFDFFCCWLSKAPRRGGRSLRRWDEASCNINRQPSRELKFDSRCDRKFVLREWHRHAMAKFTRHSEMETARLDVK